MAASSNVNGAYINAKIRIVRLLSETANVAPVSNGEVFSLGMSDRGTIEALWEITQGGETILAVIPTIDTVFSDEKTGNAIVSYKSRHDFRFVVESFTGFDPQIDLPSAAVDPYLEMALWMARSRAQATIRLMGLAQFVWPQGAVSHKATEQGLHSEQQLTQKPRRVRKAAKKSPE